MANITLTTALALTGKAIIEIAIDEVEASSGVPVPVDLTLGSIGGKQLVLTGTLALREPA